MLLDDGRFKFLGGELIAAVIDASLDIVKLLLADQRIDSSIASNIAITEAARYGYGEIFELLLSDERVSDTIEEDEDMLQEAVRGQHINILKIFFSKFRPEFIDSALMEACRVGNYEIVKLLLDVDSSLSIQAVSVQCLKIARNTKRADIEELLLSKLD
ncbi:Hypothetical protein POVR2_LOCUS305 [uncultured virus]|nr:Hypothetical protein POVR2_LOCUS305 [uncultured virus]